MGSRRWGSCNAGTWGIAVGTVMHLACSYELPLLADHDSMQQRWWNTRSTLRRYPIGEGVSVSVQKV